MADPTETLRRESVGIINSSVKSNNKISERERLEKEYGQVWDTKELQRDFEVKSFLAPLVFCTHKKTGKKGALLFQHMPRFYFSWKEE